MAIEPGRILSERYRLIRPVGQGSQASVWVADHLALTTHVAVKLISQELAKKDTARERFRREATAAAQLRSAHVVQILDHGIDGDQPFIVMELLDGEDLFERLSHRTRLTLRETSKIVTQVARALSRAHAAGIVHRDLKPENVFLCPNDDDEVVKVLDFGVAKVKDAAKVTMQRTGVGTLIGTPHYMSPEQVKGIGEIDYRADLWALGVIAFQCVTGELPFDSEGVGDLLIKITIGEAPIPSKVYPGLPASFDQWFEKACARDPNKRFQSAREMALALVALVGAADGAKSPTVRPPPRMPSIAPGLLVLDEQPRAALALEADDWEEIGLDEPEHEKAAPPVGRPSVPRPSVAPRASQRALSDAAIPKPSAIPSGSSGSSGSPAARASSTSVIVSGGGGGGADGQIVDFDETLPAHDPRLPAEVRAFALAELAEPSMGNPEGGFPKPLQGSSMGNPEGGFPKPLQGSSLENQPSSSVRPPPQSSPERSPESARPRAPQPSLVLTENGPNAPWDLPQQSAPPSRRDNHEEPPNSGGGPRSVTGRTSFDGPTSRPVPAITQFEGSSPSLSLIEDPGFDGASKRKRLTRVFLGGLLLLAVGVTVTVVRSQLINEDTQDTPGSSTSSTSVAAPRPTPTAAPTPTPTPTTPATAASSIAVDPGKVTHPTKATPSAKPSATSPRGARTARPNDGTFVIPEPDE